jgi:hypothetical protein
MNNSLHIGLSMAKCGNNSIDDMFTKNKIQYIWGHEICTLNFLTKHGRKSIIIPDFIKNYIDLTNHIFEKKKKITFVLSYNEPYKRLLSHYYYNLKVGFIKKDYLKENNYVFDQKIYDLIKVNHNFDTIVNDLYEKQMGIDLNKYTYNHNQGYLSVNLNSKITIILTKLQDLDLFNKNYFELKGEIKNKNNDENYFSNKTKVIFEKSFSDYIYNKEKKWIDFFYKE